MAPEASSSVHQDKHHEPSLSTQLSKHSWFQSQVLPYCSLSYFLQKRRSMAVTWVQTGILTPWFFWSPMTTFHKFSMSCFHIADVSDRRCWPWQSRWVRVPTKNSCSAQPWGIPPSTQRLYPSVLILPHTCLKWHLYIFLKVRSACHWLFYLLNIKLLSFFSFF